MPLKKNRQSVSELLKMVRPHRRYAALGLLAIGVTVLVQLPMPFIMRYLVDRAFPSGSTSLLSSVVGAFLCLFFVRLLFTYLRSFWLVVFRVKMGVQVRADLFRQLMSAPLSFIREQQVGTIIARLSSDVDLIQSSLNMTLFNLAVSIVTFGVGVAATLIINTPLALLSLSIIPAYAAATVWSGKYVRSCGVSARAAYGQWSKTLQESLVHAETIKAFRNEEYVTARLAQRAKEYLTLDGRREIAEVVARIMSLVLSTIAPVCLMWFGGRQVISGQMTIGWYLAFNTLLVYLYDPVQNVSEMWLSLQNSLACVDKIAELTRAIPRQTRVEERDVVIDEGKVSLVRVTFSYLPDTPVLKDLSLTCGPCDLTVVVGRSGAGKTTLLRLILGLEEPRSGEVLLDGYRLHDIPPQVLSRAVAYVPQDPFLFADTVESNIRFGLQADEREVLRAATLAYAHDFIMALPEGYRTKVGEMGHTLSGGQKQRLALARALLRRPRVLLLDEAMSDVDPDSRRVMEASLVEIATTTTVVAVVHDLSLAPKARRVVVLEDGGISYAIGTHDELLAENKTYRLLWDRQFDSRDGGRVGSH